MLDVYMRSQFKKDYKRMLQQKGCTAAQFKIVLDYLVNEKPLPEKYKDHALSNNWAGFRECHIRPDWLLIYKVEKDRNTHIGAQADRFHEGAADECRAG